MNPCEYSTSGLTWPRGYGALYRQRKRRHSARHIQVSLGERLKRWVVCGSTKDTLCTLYSDPSLRLGG